MRDRIEIEKQVVQWGLCDSRIAAKQLEQLIIIEVLLDIRDLLRGAPLPLTDYSEVHSRVLREFGLPR